MVLSEMVMMLIKVAQRRRFSEIYVHFFCSFFFILFVAIICICFYFLLVSCVCVLCVH